MRILHLCTTLLTARAFVGPLARHQARQGHTVLIGCSDAMQPESDEAPTLWIRGCPWFPVPFPRVLSPLRDFYALWRAYKLIRWFRPTVVHTSTSKAGAIGRLAAWLAGVPLILHTAHAFPFHAYLSASVRGAYILIERLLASLTDTIFVDTESVRQDGIQHRICAPEKLVVVNPGVDLKRFSPPC